MPRRRRSNPGTGASWRGRPRTQHCAMTWRRTGDAGSSSQALVRDWTSGRSGRPATLQASSTHVGRSWAGTALAVHWRRMDTVSKACRTRIMRSVRSSDTGPELYVRRIVRALHFGYRLRSRDLPGRPDLVFAGRKKVIFVHGCFWHGHVCRAGMAPRTNINYWREKRAKNQARDARVVDALSEAGWDALVIWECEVNDSALPSRIRGFLEPASSGLPIEPQIAASLPHRSRPGTSLKELRTRRR